MYQHLKDGDCAKAVEEQHQSNLDQAYSQIAMRIAFGLSSVLIGFAALVASIRF